MTTTDTPTAEEPYTTDDPVATHFHDMHSGGVKTTAFDHIFIELPLDTAIEWFVKTFGSDPNDVRCSCCGPNLSVSEHKDLRQATAHERNCQFVKVEGESGGGHYIEADNTRFGRVREHTPFEEFLTGASRGLMDNRNTGYLILTTDDLPEEWARDATSEPSETRYY